MRILLYILIWLSILFLPNRLLTTEYWHEYLGFTFLLLGGIHLFLVRSYLKAFVMRRLRLTPLNAVNTVMLLLLVTVIATGILISLYAVPVVRLRGLASVYAHAVHFAAAVTFFLIVGIHAGFHWPAIWNGIVRRLHLSLPAACAPVFRSIGAALLIAGAHAFLTTHIYEKILFEHMSFGGLVGTWGYEGDLILIFLGCMSISCLYLTWLKRYK